MYDLIIIGGGPAGAAAAIYAARKRLKTLVIAKEFAGQSVVSEDIQNWVGTIHISGKELADNMKAHILAYSDGAIEIKEGEKVIACKKLAKGFSVTTNNPSAGSGRGKTYKAKTVLVTVGSSRRKLSIPGADIYENKGITYCASCDGPLFSGQDVIVVGGGNAGFETASQLLAYAKSVTLLNNVKDYFADPVTVKKVLAHPNMKGITDVTPVKVEGDKFATSLTYQNNKTGKLTTLSTGGIFVEIGLAPATSFIKGTVKMTPGGQIKVDPRNGKTSELGIWAAGDCTDLPYHQNNIAVGDAVRALEDIYVFLKTK
ncbi:MAG: FAD-dependent oxidoreductase [Candidatus Paceibacterota bacterium]|jgi:alkyl hydroperoxide reductase subunit F|nr:FAD-dependent oxidoreductase [Candidatus Paceibacterota bacterium]